MQTTKRSSRRSPPEIARGSNPIDFEPDIFTLNDPRRIAESLKTAADRHWRRTGTAYRSAMSTLTLYLNRAGRSLGPRRRARLEAAKDELRVIYKRPRRNVKRNRVARG